MTLLKNKGVKDGCYPLFWILPGDIKNQEEKLLAPLDYIKIAIF
jgi:hypothetical protein